MRCTNDAVVEKWANGLIAKNHRGSLTADEDGALWSYDLKIGQRTDAGVCVVSDFTAPVQQYRSMTTSSHVNRAKGYADMVMHPLVWEQSPMSRSGEK